MIYGLIAFGYVYKKWTPGTLFPIGGLAALLLYVNQFCSVFQDIAWQYTEIVQYNTNVQTAAVISEAYAEQHRADRPDGLPDNWSAIILQETATFLTGPPMTPANTPKACTIFILRSGAAAGSP